MSTFADVAAIERRDEDISRLRKDLAACRAQLADARVEMGKITEYIEFMFRGVTGRNMNADEIIKYMQEQDSEYEDKREEVDVLRAQLADATARAERAETELESCKLAVVIQETARDTESYRADALNNQMVDEHERAIAATARAERAEAEMALLRAALNVDFTSGTGALGNPPPDPRPERGTKERRDDNL